MVKKMLGDKVTNSVTIPVNIGILGNFHCEGFGVHLKRGNGELRAEVVQKEADFASFFQNHIVLKIIHT